MLMDTIKKILHTCFCCNVRLAAVCRAGGTMFLFVLLPAVVAEVDVNDTLIVREILDANGLTTVPVSAVIGGGVGRIYGVYLDDLGLTVLPECIGGLDSLGNLRLNNNRLTSLPKAIGNLKKLRYLFVDNNRIHELPDELGQCTSLEMAFFINNRFTRWPTVFSDLPNLEQIDLSFNNLTEIPAEIAMYPALKELSVSFNYLSVLPEHYATMEPTYISVSGNTLCSLSTTMMEWLDTYEFNGSNREWLQDQWCDAHATDSALVRKFLDFNGWNDLPVAAVIRSSAHGVERIDVSFETRRTWQRSATGRAQLVFSGSLRMAASLRSLDLSGNHITILPDSLDQICHITELDLSDNDCVTLPEFMATFNNLTSLDLSGNLLENLPPAVAEWADRYNPGWRERQRTTRAPSNINTSPARHPLRITVRHNGQSAVIEAHIAQAFTAEIAVYSVTGRKVATLAKGNLAAGVCTFNLGDIRLGAGMYLVTVASADDKCARVRFVNH